MENTNLDYVEEKIPPPSGKAVKVFFHPEVDAQRKHLVEMIQSIPECKTSMDKRLLKEVLEYAVKHFSDEQALVGEIDYPERQAHAGIHEILTQTLLAYAKSYRKGQVDLCAFKQFVFRWVRDHIMDEDQKLGTHAKGYFQMA